MTTLHLISHTHWDREWYLTFQRFRLKLVHLLDNLLAILDSDPDYRHFMLDGQAIVLEDFLPMRPEQEAKLRSYIQAGRILIGPWYVLPDEFLVSPEAIIRNLLEGSRLCRQFGEAMKIGYTPDTFGHIVQLPQILRGFGFETASVMRGLADEPCEFWWQAPDGSRVLMAYLRDSYGNASGLPTGNLEAFTREVQLLRDSLAPHSQASHLLLMHGSDHMEPRADTSKAIAYANQHLGGDRLVHSTLPAYFAAMMAEVQDKPLPTVTGELRSSKRTPLLPGVLSARMWIKQRNHACQTLLEKYAEPFSTWASLIEEDWKQREAVYRADERVTRPAPLLSQAWRLLMQCHPHDSICGCSIDQVHAEMRPRFDQVEQIGEEITQQSLNVLAASIETLPQSTGHLPLSDLVESIVVFNPIAAPRADLVSVQLSMPPEVEAFAIISESGQSLPYQTRGLGHQELFNASMAAQEFKQAIGMIQDGRVSGLVVRTFTLHREGDTVHVELVMSENGEPDLQAFTSGLQVMESFLADPTVKDYHVRGRSLDILQVEFLAQDIPGLGYRTFWIHPLPGKPKELVRLGWIARTLLPMTGKLMRWSVAEKILRRMAEPSSRPPYLIENEFLRVEASQTDGTLTVLDKRTGRLFQGLNRFVDSGDCGDEYNYSPPPLDQVFDQARVSHVQVNTDLASQTITLQLQLQIPMELASDRRSRSAAMVKLPIQTRVSLTPGVARVNIRTEFENLARDHRLRVHFPAPFSVSAADHDGHFEILHRPTGVPVWDTSWVEQPMPQVPQRAFTLVSNEKIGLAIANRGLPEVEVLQTSPGSSEIALTLLRCVGWLSRDDLTVRKGHAGPAEATPEAQMPGKYVFEYAILPQIVGNEDGDQRLTATRQQTDAFIAPLRAISTGLHPGKLPGVASFIEIEPPSFAISAVKTTEDGRGWIVRGYNLAESACEVTLRTLFPYLQVELVNMAEIPLQELHPAEDGSLRVKAGPKQVLTFRFIPSG